MEKEERFNLNELIKKQIDDCFNDNLMETLNAALIFKYVDTLQQQLKKQKEINKKAIEYIKEKQKIQYKFALSHIECDELLEILEDKEV